ncbi:MAG: hypothetical protein JJE52_14790 [Acidimicrobiia bacterium]|nr:hypothetical protein [Acidimicrobiia bacterium]
MKPFMRPTDRARLAPVGWVAEPAGQWAGREVEIVYDPRRHDVVVVRDEPNDTTRAGIAESGYRRIAVEGRQEMWVRDRVDTAQVRLDGLGHGHGLERSAEVGVEQR